MKQHIFVIRSSYTALFYAIIVSTGLLLALYVGLWLHHEDLLATHCHTPEYWPSISTLTGDFQPERQIWRVAFVLCTSFRLGASISLFSVFRQRGCGGMNSLSGLLHSPVALITSSAFLTLVMFLCDLCRLLGGLTWTMVASAENLSRHDVGFAFYVFLGFLLQLVMDRLVRRNTYNLEIYASQREARVSSRLKRVCLIGQTTSALCLVFFYIRHVATCAAGAYSLSTMSEWSFAFFNIFFDATAWYELKNDAWVFGATPEQYQRLAFRSVNAPTEVYGNGVDPETAETTPVCSVPVSSEEGGIIGANVVVHEFTLACAPSTVAMWLVDVYWAYLFWEMIIHVVEHMYFMPMVAMSMSWELVSVAAFCSPVLLRFAAFRRWALGPAPFANTLLRGGPNAGHRRAPMYVFFYFAAALSHFHIHVRNGERLKLLAVTVGPFFLSLATFCRYLYPTVTVSDTAEDSCRLLYSFPLGLVVTMLVRVLFITQEPVYTDPLYNGLFGVVIGIVSTTVIYRHVMFVKQLPDNNSSVAKDVSVDSGGSRHVHFTVERPINSITALALSYSPSSPAIMGMLFGLLTTASLTFYTCANYIPRLLAIDPYPASLVVIFFFVMGLCYSQEIAPLVGTGKNGGASWLRLGIGLLGGCLTMLLSTRQTNRSFELKHDHYPTTMNSVKEHVDIRYWDAEEDFYGSPYIAFAGALVMTLCFGALYPLIIELLFAHQRARRLASTDRADSQGIPFQPHTLEAMRATSFELVWSLTTVLTVILYLLCISYPFVPMAWLVRERSVSMHFGNMAGIFILAWYLARRVGNGAAVARAESVTTKKQRHMPIFVVMLIGVMFFVVVICRTALEPSDRSIPPGKDIARRFPKEVVHVHEAFKKIHAESNAATDPLMEEYERTFVQERYEAQLRNLEAAVTGEEIRDTKNPKKVKEEEFGISLAHLTSEQRKDVWEAAQGMTFFSGMIWTVHFALDNVNTDSLKRMVEQADKTGAGVVGLLESDSMHVPNGNRDMVEFMSYHLGYRYTSYGPTALDNTYGCGMISKYPILRVRRYIMPSPLGELSCIIHAELDVFGITIQTWVGHFGNTEHWADGLLQSQFLGRLVRRNPGPSMFLGYVVSYPGNPERYHRYSSPTERGLLRDTALEMYRKHPWYRMQERGGYDEPEPAKTTIAPDAAVDFNLEWKIEHVAPLEEGMVPDISFRRTPEGKDPRYFKFNDTQRITTVHPRHEFIDRYCQYIFYKTGATEDERPEDEARLQPLQVYLYDWWRVINNETSSLSDTEIQVVQLGFKLRA
ncbi:FGF receptor activating protein [Trypanosoma grayi]|uniref:FGF receptor activating protein n=1 Tax=Trypanosoma grayi TaxID=71804 RepID=UPI0004F46D6D|nr:FGF receptor activating protein [Trypanosoma grayi]KEG13698.1 FGF receptor activating protein [Trypanosoma grayi]